MDPYLERHWRDVHTSLVTSSRNLLNEKLPDDLIARAEERVAIETEDLSPHHLAPDVQVFEAVGAAAPAGAGSAVVELAPYRLVALSEPATERFIEILDADGERLVTVVEFVSPTNKLGKGLEAFVEKRQSLLDGGVNFVEIDLVRSGDWKKLLRPHHCPPELVSSYRATIRLPTDRLAVQLQPISLRQPLPPVNIPLRKAEKPVQLPLQPLIEQAYRDGRYARTLNYASPPDPLLEGDNAQWADALVLEAGRK
jgi:hypothetical protein